MLNFIVLGYIPGTSVQINFADFMLFASVGGLLTFFVWYLQARRTKHKLEQLALSLIAL